MTRFAAMLFAASLLAGCATDPLQDVPRLSGADVSDSDIQAAIRAEPDEGDVTDAASASQSRGFLGRLLGGAADPEPTPAEAEADLDEAATAPEDTSATNTTEAPRGGLLGFLSRAARDAQASAGEGTTEVAAIPSQTQSDAPTTGIFGNAVANGGPGPDDPDYRIVPMGTVLPYGTLARVCDVRDRQLGARVEELSRQTQHLCHLRFPAGQHRAARVFCDRVWRWLCPTVHSSAGHVRQPRNP